MKFVYTYNLFFLPIIFIVIYVAYILYKRNLDFSAKWLKLSDTLGFYPKLKFGLRVLSITCIGLAVTGPYFSEYLEQSFIRRRAIYFVLDVSQSMQATDISPTRLHYAKSVIRNLTQTLKGEELGLIAFTTFPYTQCPLTQDTEVLLTMLDIVDTKMFGSKGTNLRKALLRASERFDLDAHDFTKHSKCIVLLTDGENYSEMFQSVLSRLQKQGIKVITVGIATPSGTRIKDHNGEYIRDNNGKVIISKLDEKLLKEIADHFDEPYLTASNDPATTAQEIYKRINQLPTSITDYQVVSAKLNIYRWLLVPGLIALAATWFLIPFTRRRFAQKIK